MRRLLPLPLLLLLACASHPSIAPSRLAAAESGPPPAGLVAGDHAPKAIVETETGSQLELGERWTNGVTAIVFYRGHWCPHCRDQLADLEKHKDAFDSANVKLVALSVDAPAEVGKLKKLLGISYDIYSDREGAALRGFQVDDQHKGIARPAMFLVAGGQVVYAYVGQNPSDHPTVDQLLAAVKAYQAKDPG